MHALCKRCEHAACMQSDTCCLALQLQQRASEVDSKKVSAAISRLLKSWQASDEEEAGVSAGSQSDHKHRQRQAASRRPDQQDAATPSAEASSNGTADVLPQELDQAPEQEAKRNRLLSLFGRGRSQQQPEELLPLRVCLVAVDASKFG